MWRVIRRISSRRRRKEHVVHWTRRRAVEESSNAADGRDAAGARRSADVRGGAGAVDVGGVHVVGVHDASGGNGGGLERERDREMAEVLVLDMAVLIPLSVVMVLIRVLHFFAFVHFRFSEAPNSETVKEGQVVVRASNLRASATFSPAKSFQANEDQSLASSSWCHLPEDLVIDQILSRLPVKSLMRFKSVCKRWHALLKTPSFIALHLKYIDTPNRLVSWNGNNNGLIVEHDAFHVFTESCFMPNFQPVNLNFGFDWKIDLVLGPCDGIFCLYWRANSNFSYHSGDYQVGVNVEQLPTIALWNPATRAFSILPMSKFDFPPYRRVTHCMVGFGFDLTASIKVVKVSSLSNAEGLQSDFINCAEVHDLSSGSWRVLHLDDMFQEVCVEDEVIVSMYNNNDGLFHWHTKRRCFSSPRYPDGDAVVLSFDMSTELFHVTPLPKNYNDYQLSSMNWMECSFALLGDSLALIYSFNNSWFSQSYVSYEGHTTVEVWVMKKDFDCMFEAGEPLSSYSWCHELTLEPPLPGSCVSTGFWNKNELLIWKDFDHYHYHYTGLRSARSTFLYDIVTKQARDVEISGELNFIYRESLVSVNGGCGNE